jgi:glyoxylase-like metal-dependent hydrolase (beta-lactamase superfamily II)
MMESSFEWLRTAAQPDVLFEDGDRVPLSGRRIGVVWMPGHTPRHICLYDADHDLPSNRR